MEQYKKETLYKTTDYDMFDLISWNRSIKFNRPESKKLFRSMKQFGFLPSHPIMVRRSESGSLIVFDGQHRLYFARQLGLPVYFVIDDSGISIPEHQQTNRKWDFGEHFERWQTEGISDYKEVIDFANRYKITIGQAAGILAGTATSSNVRHAVENGTYRIKTRDIAYSTANLFRKAKSISNVTNNSGLIFAIYACHFVDYFDANQLFEQIERNPSMLVNCDGRDGFLEVLQEIYNHRKRVKMPLAFDAKQAMEKRNVINKYRK